MKIKSFFFQSSYRAARKRSGLHAVGQMPIYNSACGELSNSLEANQDSVEIYSGARISCSVHTCFIPLQAKFSSQIS